MNDRAHQERRSGMLQHVVIAAFIAGYIVTAFVTLAATPRFVPLLTAFVTLGLLAIDVLREVSRSRLHPTEAPTTAEPAGRDIQALLLVAGGVVAIYLVGFLVALPLYLLVSIALFGRQPWRTAIAVSVLASVGIWLVFEVGLDYELFPGTLFR